MNNTKPKTINQKELEKYSIAELELMLKDISEMIVIPIQNTYRLSNKELKEMKADVIDRIGELENTDKWGNQIDTPLR